MTRSAILIGALVTLVGLCRFGTAEVGAGGGVKSEVLSKGLFFPRVWIRCQESSECVQVPADCCGCEAGGLSTAINIRFQEKYEKRSSKVVCEGRCPQNYVCPEGAVAFCNAEGRCEFGVP